MLVIVFNDKLLLAKKLGDERDCALRYLSHIDLTDMGRPFELDAVTNTAAEVRPPTLSALPVRIGHSRRSCS